MARARYAEIADAEVLSRTGERGRVEDQARRRLGIEPLALSDETLERIESLGNRGGQEALELLASLPADQRRAVQGRVLEERDYHELARTLRCSRSRDPETPQRARLAGPCGRRRRCPGRGGRRRGADRAPASGRRHSGGPFERGCAPPMPNVSGPEWNLIVKARRETVAHDSACSPFVGSRRPFRTGSLAGGADGDARRPAPARECGGHGCAHALPTRSIRHLPLRDPARPRAGRGRSVRRADREEAAALGRQMKGAPAKQKAAALDGQRRYLVWQEYEAEHPQGVCLAEVDHNRTGVQQLPAGAVGCGRGVGEIEQGLAGLGKTALPGPSLFHGIVPDGVATVVLDLPGRRGTVTARVVNNVYVASIPRSVHAPVRVIWRAADGSVIRTTRVP